MRNVPYNNKKTCICLTGSNFENVLLNIYGNDSNFNYDPTCLVIYAGDDAKETEVLYDDLARYFDVGKITSIHVEDEGSLLIWIVYQGESYTLDNSNEYMLTRENLPEFLGQIVDIFEDFTTEEKIFIPSTDRDDEIKAYREDESTNTSDMSDEDIIKELELANIYGSTYDSVIGDVETMCSSKLEKNEKFTEDEVRQAIDYCMNGFISILPKDFDQYVVDQAKDRLESQVVEIFLNWGVAGDVYYTTHNITARYCTEVKALSGDDAIKKADAKFSNADFGEASDIDGECVKVEDEGDILWEKPV